MIESVIDTRKLRKVYRVGAEDVVALDGVSVRVRGGESVAVMGPSGSGKSTFMNLIGCLDQPTSGTYLLEGQDVSRLHGDKLAEVRSRKIGFVFQGFNLLSRNSAAELRDNKLNPWNTKPILRLRTSASLSP